MDNKKCVHCGQDKPLDEMRHHYGRPLSVCKECSARRNAARYFVTHRYTAIKRRCTKEGYFLAPEWATLELFKLWAALFILRPDDVIQLKPGEKCYSPRTVTIEARTSKPLSDTVAEAIFAMRKFGLTPTQIAGITGYSVSTVSRVLSGKTKFQPVEHTYTVNDLIAIFPALKCYFIRERGSWTLKENR